MSPFDVFLLGVAAILIVVAVLAIRFPRGRAEWPLDARQTAWLLVSGLTAVVDVRDHDRLVAAKARGFRAFKLGWEF